MTCDAPGACRDWNMNTISDAVLAQFAPAAGVHARVALVMPDECIDSPGIAIYAAHHEPAHLARRLGDGGSE